MIDLVYKTPREPLEKPRADISIATDYDQRYLKMISKFFYKEMTGWNDRSEETLNNVLKAGGNIAMFWDPKKMDLVGAVVWSGNDDTWRIDHICFKFKFQRLGYGRLLLDFVVHKIGANANLMTSLPKEAGAVNFFNKYGFSAQGEV